MKWGIVLGMLIAEVSVEYVTQHHGWDRPTAGLVCLGVCTVVSVGAAGVALLVWSLDDCKRFVQEFVQEFRKEFGGE